MFVPPVWEPVSALEPGGRGWLPLLFCTALKRVKQNCVVQIGRNSVVNTQRCTGEKRAIAFTISVFDRQTEGA